jgi:hypothetical protein
MQIEWKARWAYKGKYYSCVFKSLPRRSIARIDFMLLCTDHNAPIPKGFIVEEVVYDAA